MSKASPAKVSRRRINLETVVFSAQQEVTVPVVIKIPAGTQYLLHPILMLPKHKLTIQQGPGKIRVLGQLEGMLSCVDSSETVRTLPVPPMEFMAAFTAPVLPPGAKVSADAVIQGVEVDRDEDNVANITAFVSVDVWVLNREETEIITDVAADSLIAERQSIKLQHIIKEIQAEKKLNFTVAMADAEPGGTELCIANLSWQVVDGKLSARGVVLANVLCLGESQGIGIAQGSEEFELEMDFGTAEITESMLHCYPLTVTSTPGESGLKMEIVLQAVAMGYREEAGEYLTNLIGADSLDKTLHLRNRIGESEFKLNLDGLCQFPVEPAVINVVLPKVRIIEVKAMDEKVLVRGMLSLNIYYTDEDEQKRVLVQEEEFNQFFELQGCTPDYNVTAWAWPETGECSDERYSVPVLLRVEVIEDVEFTAVTDIHMVDPEFIPVDASVVLYIVKQEDNLFTIAKKFNISQEMLREYNGMVVDEVHPGQKLMVPIYSLKYKS